jgi:hypothetical protein
MNPPLTDSHLDALLTRARTARPDTGAAEYAFETRLLARLRAFRPADSAWAVFSWRLMPLFAAVVLVLVCWQNQVSTDDRETAQMASLGSVDPGDLGEGN